MGYFLQNVLIQIICYIFNLFTTKREIDYRMCSLGNEIEDECDKLSHTRSIGRKKMCKLLADQQKVLSKRTNIPHEQFSDPEFDICFHHEQAVIR